MAMLRVRLSAARATGLVSLSVLALFAGCRQEEIRVYVAPKDAPPPASQSGPGHDHEHGQAAHGRPATVKYQLPQGWKEMPAGMMRAARFTVHGADGAEADVSIIAMGGVTAGRADILNIWREQLELPPLGEQEAAQPGQAVKIGGHQGELFDLVSTRPLIDGKTNKRILVAMLQKESDNWFVKMTGPEALVAQTKPVLIEFLGTLELGATSGDSAHANPPAPRPESPHVRADATAGARPAWSKPEGWQETAPGPMLTAKFLVTDAGAQAEITVSSLGGDGGGALPNVNRWRGQLLLKPIDAAELEKSSKPLPVGAAKGVVVEMEGTSAKTGNPARMVVVTVPVGDRTWYFKLLGDSRLVESQRAAFLKFVETTRFPHAG